VKKYITSNGIFGGSESVNKTMKSCTYLANQKIRSNIFTTTKNSCQKWRNVVEFKHNIYE